MKPLYILTSILVFVSSVTFSQATYLGGTYSISVPLGNLEDFITSGSYRGANFEGLKEIKSNLAVGWLLGWNVFAEKRAHEVYNDDNLTLTGTQYRYMNLFPMLARGLYEFGTAEGTRPFIGSGLGITADLAKTNVGLYSFRKTGWHFTLAPELGIKIPVGNTSITASLRYVYGAKTREIDRISYLSVNLGMLWGE
jgi:outer membrane protein